MSSVILYIATSLDGFIARRDGDISWLDKYQGGKEDYGYSDFYENVGASVMGTNTYEKALTLRGGIDNKLPTYVITHRKLQNMGDADITFYSGSLSELVNTIRKKTQKDIWLVGGGQLTQSFLKENLLDRIILSTIPIILGEGISLFGNLKREINCTLKDTKSYKNGIVQTHYRLYRGRSNRPIVRVQ
jgi:dihydrofolate reductase